MTTEEKRLDNLPDEDMEDSGDIGAQIVALTARKRGFEDQLEAARLDLESSRKSVTLGAARPADIEKPSRKVAQLETAVSDIESAISECVNRQEEMRTRESLDLQKLALRGKIDEGLKALSESQTLFEKASINLRKQVEEILDLREITFAAQRELVTANPDLIREVATQDELSLLGIHHADVDAFNPLHASIQRPFYSATSGFFEIECTALSVESAYRAVDNRRTNLARIQGE